MIDFELDMSEFLDLFVDESRQNLKVLNQGMLALEQDRAAAGVIEDVFRAAHTLKGMAATMGCAEIAQVAHALESALDIVRSDPEALTDRLIELIFRGADMIDMLVLDVAEGGQGTCDISEILAALRHCTLDEPPPDHSAGSEAPGMADAPTDSADAPCMADAPTDSAKAPGMAKAPFMADAPTDSADVHPAAPARRGYPEGVAEAHWSSVMGGLEAASSTAAASTAGGSDELSAVELARSGPSRLVRLDVQRLDAVLDVVSELVIHRSYMSRVLTRCDNPELDEVLVTYHQLLDRLQAVVLETRMVPIGQAFDRFPRMVRDLLKSQGKTARFIVEGSHVELDRTMLAAINDALVHLLRNAVDHGLETPEERVAAGKDPEGTLRLTARSERSTVIIEVVDDGRGIDAARVAERALQRGLVTPGALQEMTEGQVLGLLCAPGFTLAEAVTDISGRGVGMDAVQSQVAAVRGSLEIATELGEGSTFRLRLPVNLALTDAVLVRIGGEVYAVPASTVERVVEIAPAQVSRLGRRLLLNLSDGVVPLSDVCHNLDGEACPMQPSHALIARRHDQLFAVGVDAVLGYEQVVAKPMPPGLAGLPGLAGVTILAEGQVVFILDLMQF